MEIAEHRAFVRQAVQIRRGETFDAEFADIGVALIVGKDNDDVGLVGCRRFVQRRGSLARSQTPARGERQPSEVKEKSVRLSIHWICLD
jgi:hypothetical protein